MYGALVVGYGVASILLWGLASRGTTLWPARHDASAAPLPVWKTALLMLTVLVIGDAYRRAWLLPERGPWHDATRAINQMLIFSPVFAAVAVAAVTGKARERALAPMSRVFVRVAAGTLAAAVAIVAYVSVLPDGAQIAALPSRLFASVNVAHAVQILGEDLALGLMLATLLRYVRPRWAILATGALFAVGHVPAMLTNGEPLSELVRLAGDAALASGVLALVLRLRDLWALWPVHVAMDLMQFYGRN